MGSFQENVCTVQMYFSNASLLRIKTDVLDQNESLVVLGTRISGDE